MASNPLIQRWPNLPADLTEKYPELDKAIRLLYNAVDDHTQAFHALKPQVDTAQKTATTAVESSSKKSGGVTSVGLQMPPEFLVQGSPVIGAGTFQVSKATQPANTLYAGPVGGADAEPNFRLAVPEDLPIATVADVGAVKPDGVTILIAGDGTIDVPIATVADVGVVKPDGSTITVAVDGTISAAGGAFDPETSLVFYDDFTSLQGLSSGSNTWDSQYPWFRSGSDQEFADWSEPSFIGAVQIHSPAGGQEAMYLNSIAGPNFLTIWGTKIFDFKFRFKLSDVVDGIAYHLGVADAGSPQFYSNGFGIHFDVSALANFTYQTKDGIGTTTVDSGILADAAIHIGRIRSTVPGTLLFSIDGSAEVAVNTNVPSVNPANPTFVVGTFGTTTIAHSCLLDWVWFTIAR